jgi:hypothetical protein
MTKPSDMESPPALSASVQVLALPTGLYLFSVKAATANGPVGDSQLRVPAMHVGLGPGVRAEQVEFIAGPATHGAWLFVKEDLLVAKIGAAGATLVLTSVRGPGGEVLTIKVERLDTREDDAALAEAASPPLPVVASTEPQKSMPAMRRGTSLPLQVTAHIRSRGDMNFSNVPWAGRVAPGLWIEAFSIRPLDGFTAQDIEYKGLTGSGFETPWLSDVTMCGTKGLAVPLVGFAVRLKPGHSAASAYDCEYSGYFKSGCTVGPLRNGAPCRSTAANDPLEGIQMRITLRAATPSIKIANVPGRPDTQTAIVKGPYFGRYREDADLQDKEDVSRKESSQNSRLELLSDRNAKAVSDAEPRRKPATVANPVKRPVNS